jgi:hypothetical protein
MVQEQQRGNEQNDRAENVFFHLFTASAGTFCDRAGAYALIVPQRSFSEKEKNGSTWNRSCGRIIRTERICPYLHFAWFLL